ncbi:MAG TPA: hypothetical protein VL523_10905 [Terriglobia bacterium]|nr:hypothetical protein [Terriglobia bacterium]
MAVFEIKSFSERRASLSSYERNSSKKMRFLDRAKCRCLKSSRSRKWAILRSNERETSKKGAPSCPCRMSALEIKPLPERWATLRSYEIKFSKKAHYFDRAKCRCLKAIRSLKTGQNVLI